MKKEIENKLISGNLSLSDLFNNNSYFFQSMYDKYEILSNPYYNGENFKLTIINDNGKYKIEDNYLTFLQCKKLINKREIMFLTKKNPSFYKKMIENNFHYLDFFRVKDFYENFIKNKHLLNLNKETNSLLDFIKSTSSIEYLESNIKNFFYRYNIKDSNIYIDIDKKTINEENRKDIVSLIKKLNENYNPLSFLDLPIEEIEDIINQKKIGYNYNSIITKRLSGNYKKMINDNSYEIIYELAKIGVTHDIFYNEFSKKISIYKNSKELEDGLKKYFYSKVGWSIESYLNKIKEYEENNEKLNYYLEDNKIILRVKNYKESIFFGSNNWCISYNEYDFNNYVKNKKSIQIFVFDFNLTPENDSSMIGFTVGKNGYITDAHDKFDKNIIIETKESEILNNIKKKIDKVVINSDDLICLNNFEEYKDLYYSLLKKEIKMDNDFNIINEKKALLPDYFYFDIIENLLEDRDISFDKNLAYLPSLFKPNRKRNDNIINYLKNNIDKENNFNRIFIFKALLSNTNSLKEYQLDNVVSILLNYKEDLSKAISSENDKNIIKKIVESRELETTKLYFCFFSDNKNVEENNKIFKSIKNEEIKKELFNLIIRKELNFYPEILLTFQDDDLKKYGKNEKLNNDCFNYASDIEKILNAIDFKKHSIFLENIVEKIKENKINLSYENLNSSKVFLFLKEKNIFKQKDYECFLYNKLGEFNNSFLIDKNFIKDAELLLKNSDYPSETIMYCKGILDLYKKQENKKNNNIKSKF